MRKILKNRDCVFYAGITEEKLVNMVIVNEHNFVSKNRFGKPFSFFIQDKDILVRKCNDALHRLSSGRNFSFEIAEYMNGDLAKNALKVYSLNEFVVFSEIHLHHGKIEEGFRVSVLQDEFVAIVDRIKELEFDMSNDLFRIFTQSTNSSFTGTNISNIKKGETAKIVFTPKYAAKYIGKIDIIYDNEILDVENLPSNIEYTMDEDTKVIIMKIHNIDANHFLSVYYEKLNLTYSISATCENGVEITGGDSVSEFVEHIPEGESASFIFRPEVELTSIEDILIKVDGVVSTVDNAPEKVTISINEEKQVTVIFMDIDVNHTVDVVYDLKDTIHKINISSVFALPGNIEVNNIVEGSNRAIAFTPTIDTTAIAGYVAILDGVVLDKVNLPENVSCTMNGTTKVVTITLKNITSDHSLSVEYVTGAKMDGLYYKTFALAVEAAEDGKTIELYNNSSAVITISKEISIIAGEYELENVSAGEGYTMVKTDGTNNIYTVSKISSVVTPPTEEPTPGEEQEPSDGEETELSPSETENTEETEVTE